MAETPEAWSGDWWKRHWLGAVGLVLLGFLLGYLQGVQEGERRVSRRIGAEYPAVARDMLRRDMESDSLAPQRDQDEAFDTYRGH